ncbi:hypothetical protein ZOSMA_257G00010 [Zostera marina]|uniref:Uncharacterized protein n=1 Tax=Zostera marina TaxID=29655 RepID=A0A0K9PHX8_ZOSMR|nr:hypothetical protein ZOSMA_257G00010 [Zostera marina]
MHHLLISKTDTSEEENPETLSNPEAGSVCLLFSLGRKELATMVLWVFGYGSLIWNPGFDFDQKILGYIKDYRRVFDLACIDHRGTPEHPARTLSVESKRGALGWGIAYCVRGGLEKERMAMEYPGRGNVNMIWNLC